MQLITHLCFLTHTTVSNLGKAAAVACRE